MSRPKVEVILGNNNLGRTAATTDSVAGMILTGKAVGEKLELNRVYQLSSTRDLVTLGVTKENNPLANKEIREFYAQVGEGAELHLLIVAEATTLTDMCDSGDGSPLRKLIAGGGGRIRIVGVNKIAPDGYVPDLTAEIDQDAITAASKAQLTADNLASMQYPFRMLLPAPAWSGETTELFKPRESTTNRVGIILASDDSEHYSAAVGQVLGRAAKIGVHQNIGRVADGAIASEGYATNGESYLSLQGKYDLLHDAGYISYVNHPTKNGCYLNSDPMAAPRTDDYSALRLGRVIDKAQLICYSTFIELILDTVEVDQNGYLPVGACRSFETMLENAIATQMTGEISSFSAYINPDQNILSTETMVVEADIVPTGVLEKIRVNLSFSNPALNV